MRRRLAAVGSWLSLAAAVFVLGAVVLLQPAESTPIGLQRRETTTTATAGSPAGAEAESDDCRQRYLLPVIVGVVALLALLFILYYCGRQRINASLFEQTLRAERFAQVGPCLMASCIDPCWLCRCAVQKHDGNAREILPLCCGRLIQCPADSRDTKT